MAGRSVAEAGVVAKEVAGLSLESALYALLPLESEAAALSLESALCALLPLESEVAALLPLGSEVAALLPLESEVAALLPLESEVAALLPLESESESDSESELPWLVLHRRLAVRLARLAAAAHRVVSCSLFWRWRLTVRLARLAAAHRVVSCSLFLAIVGSNTRGVEEVVSDVVEVGG